MEQTMEKSRPENRKDSLDSRLYQFLSVGVDLDDMIFSGEEWHHSER